MRSARMLVAAACVAVLATQARADERWPDLSSPPSATGTGQKDAAVIIGIENYAFVEKIPGARRNAEDWHAHLTETLKVPSDRVVLLRDNEATLEKMRRFATEAAASVQPGGTLWFVFIGHGAPSRDGRDGLLIGVDAQQEADSLVARGLARSELLSLLANGRHARSIVLLDACFSGRSGSGQALVAGLQPLVASVTRPAADARTLLLTAAASDQFAGPLPKSDEPRPAFSYLALGGLRGWAADEDGKVTAAGLVEFARKALKLAKDRIQTPELSAGKGDALLAMARETAPNLARIDRGGATSLKEAAAETKESGSSTRPVGEAPAAAALIEPEKAVARAPESFKVRMVTTKGPFVIAVTRSWAPIGADRFYNLVKMGFYDDVAFFRVLSGFMAQTGIHGDPRVSAKWRGAAVSDDLRAKSNTRGRVTFATGGPNTRTTQVFFNYGDNSRLDGMGFTPFGEVVEGMDALEKLHAGYGEGAPRGPGPDQGRIQAEGNTYLRRDFPLLDYIKSARLE